MRRILIGLALVSIAIAAAIVLDRPDPPRGLTEGVTITIERDHPPIISIPDVEIRLLPQHQEPYRRPEISAMDCRVVAEEALGGDLFMLTEECAWKDGRVERRQFRALRKEDGPAYGWMYRPTESET